MRYSGFTADDEKRFIKLTEKGISAVFIYSNRVCSNGQLKFYDENDKGVRTIAISGVVFVPVSYFTEILGFTVKNENEKICITDGKLNKFEYEAKEINGRFYVPIIEAALSLGLSASALYDNRMVAVGPKKEIEKLKNDQALTKAGAYVLFGEYDAKAFSSDDYKQARAKWKLLLVGNKDINDLSDPFVVEKINAIDENCKKLWETMNKDGDPVILWGDRAPVESAELVTQYGYISRLAKGYATYGSEYYHNKALLDDIIFGMEWMYSHMFGEAEIAGTGWRDVHTFNWWSWFVGGPEHMTDIMFMLEDEISLEDRKRYLKCFKWITTFMCNRKENAMSRISICTKVALATEDAEMLQREYSDFDLRLVLTERENGPHIDYVDYTHGFPHNMSYGILNLDRVLLVASVLSGTPLEFSNPQQYNQFGMAKFMYEPAMYCGQGFSMFIGRSLTRAGYETGVSAIINLLPMIGVVGPDEDAYLKKLVKRNSVHERIRKKIRSGCSFYYLAKYNEIIADESISYENDYEYAHSWFTGDRAAQHRNDYAIGIALSSNRQITYESINGENKTGWYTGDGATYLYTKYDDNAYETVNFIKNTNIAYRFPGTTEDERKREARSIRYSKGWRPTKSYAGSVQIQDKYIVAAMDYESFNFDGPDENLVDDGGGVGLAVHKNDLASKKSWFCFDDEIVYLSAGITSTMNSKVNTTLDHRRIVKDEEFSQFVSAGGEVEKLEKQDFEKKYIAPKWVNMEGHVGFLFLEDSEVYVNRYVSEECGGQSYFEVGISHGVNPTDSSYAYAVIPYATNEKLDKYYKDPDVEIISNTSAIQAVREKNLNIAGYAFYSAGKCENIETDSPLIITARYDGDKLEIIATDPSHELKEAKISVHGAYAVSECENAKIKVDCLKTKANIKIDLLDANGRPFRVVFDKK